MKIFQHFFLHKLHFNVRNFWPGNINEGSLSPLLSIFSYNLIYLNWFQFVLNKLCCARKSLRREIAFRFITNFLTVPYMYSFDGRWSGKRNLWRHTLKLKEEQWQQKKTIFFSLFLFVLLLTLNKRWRRKIKICKNRILFPVDVFFLLSKCKTEQSFIRHFLSIKEAREPQNCLNQKKNIK